MDKNIEKKQHAQLLYITQGKSHAEIAEEVGVSERTVFTWVHQYAWDKLRLAAYQAPVSIANNLCEEIVELQQNIAQRDAGQRFPTPQESITMQRMVSCLDKLKKYPSLSQNMQVLESFKNYIKPLDKDFSKILGNYTNRYLSSAAQNGFVPYQLEYGVDAAPPLAPYYDEEEIATDTPSASTWHPDSPINYTIPGLHHARPYLIPLMHICYDQLVEDQQRAEAMSDYLEQHCSTTDTAPEVSGSKTEVEAIENGPEGPRLDEASDFYPGSPEGLASETSQIQKTHPEVSGSKTEVEAIENCPEGLKLNEASDFQPGSPQGLAPETSQIQKTHTEAPGSKTPAPPLQGQVVPRGKPFISPRLEDFLFEASRSEREEDDSTGDKDIHCDENMVTSPEVSGSKTEVGPIENGVIDGSKNVVIQPEASGSENAHPDTTGDMNSPVIPPQACAAENGLF